jgi:hypothetical protein
VKTHLYIEGGESKEDQARCRQGFRLLLERAGLRGRMPRLSACGSRNSAFDDFKTAHSQRGQGDYNALLVDSEDSVEDLEKTWDHLKTRDNWAKPDGACDEQVLLMTTCMETWIIADRPTLGEHYGHRLQENALPPLHALEQRNRHDVQDKLEHATAGCQNAYAKGKRSFEVVAKLRPGELTKHLPSFVRVVRILNDKL